MAVYKASEGAGFTDEKAKIYGEEIKKLGKGVTPQEVVDAARKKRSPLHEMFEWDDDEASRKWRVQQARHLIGHIEIIIDLPNGKQSPIRAFHSVPVRVRVPSAAESEEYTTERKYVRIEYIDRNAEMRDDVIDKAKRELASWRRRYAMYREVLGNNLWGS